MSASCQNAISPHYHYKTIVYSMAKMLHSLTVYPFLFAIYPILFLFAFNLGQTSLEIVLKLIMLCLTAVWFLMVGVYWLHKDWGKTGVICSLLILLFFSYGHIKSLLNIHDAILSGIWLCIIFVLSRKLSKLKLTNKTTFKFNIFAIILAVLQIAVVSNYYFYVNSESGGMPEFPEIQNDFVSPLDYKPDIYYLIFDRYANREVLSSQYDFENNSFLEKLQSYGFKVNNNSYSNYHRTTFSLASSLNMEYVDRLIKSQGPTSINMLPAEERLRNNLLQEFLKKKGYKYVHVSSGWDPTSSNPHADSLIRIKIPSEFPLLIYRTSWLSVLENFGLWDVIESHKARILLASQEIPKATLGYKEPVFVMSHFILPHPPFIFNQDGSTQKQKPLTEQEREQRYLEQLKFTNKYIETMMSEILSNSENPPIIVLQADEGPYPYSFVEQANDFNWEEAKPDEIQRKLAILNAVYLPDQDYSQLPAKTPINTFRFILNQYFGTQLDSLSDKYFLPKIDGYPYDLVEVTDQVSSFGDSFEN